MHKTRLVFLIALFVLWSLDASATVLVPADFGELAHDAGAQKTSAAAVSSAGQFFRYTFSFNL